MKKLIVILIVSMNSLKFFSQNRAIDSLFHKLEAKITTSERANVLNNISWQYILLSEFKKAIDYSNKAKKIIIDNDVELARSFNNIAYAFNGVGDFENALANHLTALKLREKEGDNAGIISSYNGVGGVYFAIGNYKMASYNYYKALNLAQIANDSISVEAVLISLGNVFYSEAKDDEALEYYNKALQYALVSNNQYNIAVLESNIGNIYFSHDEFEKAIEAYLKSCEIRKLIDDKKGISESFYNLGLANSRLRKYASAIKYFNQSLVIAHSIGAKETEMLCYEAMSELFKNKGEFLEALNYYTRFSELRDTLVNLESAENINKLNTIYESEKKDNTIKLMNKDKERQFYLNEQEIKKRNLLIILFIIVITFVLIFAVFFYKSSKQKQRDNNEIHEQKLIIEHKNKEMTDSINYALRIQNSFLASETLFKEFLSDYFILFKPKDIVSGDFYWANTQGDIFYLCVADSTGHGIPGAFMSLLNISLLNEALLSRNLKRTNEILDFVRRILILGLKVDNTGQGGNDGMDCSLISINRKTKKLSFSGANNAIWILRNGKMFELNPDKMPVGRSPLEHNSFTSKEFDLLENDILYLFSDGFPDQFGGPKGKKFMYKNLKETFISMKDLTLQEQVDRLDNQFIDWKGELEQVDDVCVIGIKV